MKKDWIKVLPILILIFPLIFSLEKNEIKNSNLVFNSQKKVENSVEEIINDNKDKTIQENKTISDKFIYLEFTNKNQIYSYYIDKATGEKANFEDFIKADKKEAFKEKINELLYLKYPKFIADILIEDQGDKVYKIDNDKLIIYFDNFIIEPVITEKLYLTIDYNEIKEYLDFSFVLNKEYQNEDGFIRDKNKKAVAFTFDDGPAGETTNKIVDLLEQNKAHATFFMVGNKMEYGANTIQNVLEKGNEIGSHSYAHKSMKRQKFPDLIKDEEKTKEIYRNITGKDLIYTRPPYGAIDAKIKENLDTIFITWDLDPEDWLRRDKNYIIDYVMENVKDGDIILMHDLYDSTVEAVAELLPKLYAEGYQVVSISELASLKEQTLEKHNIYRNIRKN